MTSEIEKLSTDYRVFNPEDLPYSFSTRILSPVVCIDRKEGKYTIELGANINKSGQTTFIPCISIYHNWLIDRDRIKPLPHDVSEILRASLADEDPDDLRFSAVLHLYTYGIEGMNVVVSPEVFEKANTRSLELSLESNITGLNAKLYKYQEQGVAWMREALECFDGVILADEMGLGKTIQIISLLLLKKPNNEHPALIVCPATLIANWCREITFFSPHLTIVVHRGESRTGFYKDLMRSKIVVTTYDTLVNDISLFLGVEWGFLICDEAQAAKNPDSQRRIALGKLNRRYTIPVTGTPMENSLMDLWSLGDLAIPGVLGNRNDFAVTYPDDEDGANKLSTVVDAFVLKRQVSDVANDLPEKTVIDFPVELDRSGIVEYVKIRQDVISEYGDAGKLVAVGQLALYCAHPWLRATRPSDNDWDESVELDLSVSSPLFTAKMAVCVDLLKEAFMYRKKVLIFAAYNKCGELIMKASGEKELPEAYWNVINGATPQLDRQAIVDEFTKYVGPAVLILNPKAAGTGLNITAATVVIHYTQNWNPALEMQASARAHRRGQSQPVTIYRLYYQGTIEETMIARSQWKRELGAIAVPISARDNEDLDNALNYTPTLGS